MPIATCDIFKRLCFFGRNYLVIYSNYFSINQISSNVHPFVNLVSMWHICCRHYCCCCCSCGKEDKLRWMDRRYMETTPHTFTSKTYYTCDGHAHSLLIALIFLRSRRVNCTIAALSYFGMLLLLLMLHSSCCCCCFISLKAMDQV